MTDTEIRVKAYRQLTWMLAEDEAIIVRDEDAISELNIRLDAHEKVLFPFVRSVLEDIRE